MKKDCGHSNSHEHSKERNKKDRGHSKDHDHKNHDHSKKRNETNETRMNERRK